jgi:hypothetical protein
MSKSYLQERQQYTSVVETDKTTDNLANKEDTNWHNSLAGNIVSSTDVLKHKKISAIFTLKMKNRSSPCNYKDNFVRTKNLAKCLL